MRTLFILLVVAGCGEGGEDDGALRGAAGGGYRLPWTCGSRHWVSQGNGGDLCGLRGDHRRLQEHAWDFAMDRGEPVRASRGGVVSLAVEVSQSGDACFDGCPYPHGSADLADCCKRCVLLANRVNIDHGDGTVATYWHLARVRARAGDVVRAGAVLGEAGTSGCSTGPHLHFQVMGPCPTDFCQSRPIRFAEDPVPACGALLRSENCW